MNTTMQTVRDVVAADFRTAAVFQKHGLDFCCGGDVSLEEACGRKGLDTDSIRLELDAVLRSPRDGAPDYNAWEPDFLVDYIVANHHAYVRRVLPTVRHHAEKVARVHGARHPETVQIAELFNRVAAELDSHMMREESILFPYMKNIAAAARAGETIAPPMFGSVRNPIAVMEMDHDAAGDALESMRKLSSDYPPPEDACMTYRVLYQELAEFEADLHKHVHLENNILFPKSIALEERVVAVPS